jgi:hypothetical protein
MLGKLTVTARLSGLLLACALGFTAPALASPLAGWTLVNEAVMRFLGFKVYEIRLWHQGASFSRKAPFALELEYAMRFKGRDIAARSVEEMKAQGYSDAAALGRWRQSMQRLFPDVNAGDRLIGIAIPGKEARFFAGDRMLGTVKDPAFVEAFFDIWLSPKTRAPRVRQALLGSQ